MLSGQHLKPISSMLDKRFLTLFLLNATNLPIAVKGWLVYALFDKSSNVTLLNMKLSKQLGINM